MTKDEIMNTYTIEQGYESWEDLYIQSDRIFTHFNNVTDLIQEELKKKISVSVIAVDKFLGCNINSWEDIENSILNTEIL